jgi:hypothetical protein
MLSGRCHHCFLKTNLTPRCVGEHPEQPTLSVIYSQHQRRTSLAGIYNHPVVTLPQEALHPETPELPDAAHPCQVAHVGFFLYAQVNSRRPLLRHGTMYVVHRIRTVRDIGEHCLISSRQALR